MIPREIANTIVDPTAYGGSGRRAEAAFTWLRREKPLSVAQPDNFDPFWVVTRHADILDVERQNDLFHNGDRATIVTPIDLDQKIRMVMGGSPHLVRALVHMDNPDHAAYRRITYGAFLPQNLKRLEGRIRDIARGFIDHMAALGGHCDFATDIAFLYPLHVIMELLGVPASDEPRMLKLTQELFGNADAELSRGGNKPEDAAQALANLQGTVGEFIEYFSAITEDRRNNPRDDLASVIANGAVFGAPLGVLEAMSYYIIAATAGHDTTSSTTAGAMWALAENPDQFEKVKADPARIPGLVEESIRWVTPVKHFMRSATADTELDGRAIRKGDWLMLSYPSANRDEAVFKDPFRFEIERSPNRHVAFGYGAHICLGQHLGRMEMRILWEELLPRLENVQLNGEPANMDATFVCGPKRVPISYRMQ
jgi:cytochrome P450